MYYLFGNFVPWRGPAWALLTERTALLAAQCATAADLAGVPAEVAAAGETAERAVAALAPHVPPALRPKAG